MASVGRSLAQMPGLAQSQRCAADVRSIGGATCHPKPGKVAADDRFVSSTFARSPALAQPRGCSAMNVGSKNQVHRLDDWPWARRTVLRELNAPLGRDPYPHRDVLELASRLKLVMKGLRVGFLQPGDLDLVPLFERLESDLSTLGVRVACLQSELNVLKLKNRSRRKKRRRASGAPATDLNRNRTDSHRSISK